MTPITHEAFRLEHLSTGYRPKGRVVKLASDLSATLRPGRLTCLLGANGAGKSTLLRTLAGFQPALDGEVWLCGKRLASYRAHELSQKIGVVLTDKAPAPNLTATELVAMGRMPYTGFWGTLSADDRRLVAEAIDAVGMTAFANRKLSSMSDGEVQKLYIAKALAQQTPILLLDEPVAFLDFPSKVDILLLLKRLAREKGIAVLLSIHDLEMAFRLADELWLLNSEGQLLQGTPKELSRDGSLDFFFERNGLRFDREQLQYSFPNE